MEKILTVIKDNRARRQPYETTRFPPTEIVGRRSSVDHRARSTPSTFGVADLADNVSELRQDFKQLQEEVRRGCLLGNSELADQAVQEMKHVQEHKFRLYDLEIKKCSAGVTELHQRMNLSKFDPAAHTEQGNATLLQQISAELKRVTRQQEEFSGRLDLLEAAASKDMHILCNLNGTEELEDAPNQRDQSVKQDVAVDFASPIFSSKVFERLRIDSSKWEKVMTGSDAMTHAQMHGSTWNATAFIASGVLNTTGNIEICILLVLTVLAQVAMVLIVLFNMTANDFEDSEWPKLRDWRMHVAGKVEYMEPTEQLSLGSRVCDPEAHASLELSYQQALLVRSLEEYFGTGEIEATHTIFQWGPLMCLLALFSWFLCVLSELQSALGLLFAFSVFPRAHETCFVYESPVLALKAVSSTRYAFVTLSVLIRIVMALSLGYSGAKWLIATKGVENLLLNNCALEIVLDMDERIFEALAPCLLKRLMERIQPLPVENIHRAWRARLSQLGLIISLILALAFGLVPEMENRQEAWRLLCKGKKNFVHSADAAGYLYWVSFDKRPYTDVHNEVVQNIIDEHPNADPFELPTVVGSIYSLEAITGQSAAERGTRWNVHCEDFFSPERSLSYSLEWLLRSFRTDIGVDSFQICQDLPIQLCNDETIQGMKARQFCSTHCGCRSAASPFPLATPAQGCPTSCQHLPSYWYAPEMYNCTGKPSSQVWKAFAGNLTETTSRFRAASAWWSTFAKNVSTMGCQALVDFFNDAAVGITGWERKFNLCEGTGVSNPLRAFTAICNTTCKCIAEPDTCPAGCPMIHVKNLF